MQAENSASEIHIQDPMAEKRNSNDIKECQSKIEKSPGIVSSEEYANAQQKPDPGDKNEIPKGKAFEVAIVARQLQEQLQGSLVPANYFLTGSHAKEPQQNSNSLQQLQIHQQHLVAQLQWLYGSSNRKSLPNIQENGHNALPDLLKDERCQWPGCEKSQFLSKTAFSLHLDTEHQLTPHNAAQAKVQQQIVIQLEESLTREKQRLEAMMKHLSKEYNQMPVDTHTKINKFSHASSGKLGSKRTYQDMAKSDRNLDMGMSSSKVWETENDIMRNRDFYKMNDVRPPFTYASLIRQAIVESADRQLTLNEIYTWFQNNFAYFRRNAATWKNAIRTNLSLHKCFVRFEDDFGSYWTVDDGEFLKRRHLSRGRPRNASGPVNPNAGPHGSPAQFFPATPLDFSRLVNFGIGELPDGGK